MNKIFFSAGSGLYLILEEMPIVTNCYHYCIRHCIEKCIESITVKTKIKYLGFVMSKGIIKKEQMNIAEKIESLSH